MFKYISHPKYGCYGSSIDLVKRIAACEDHGQLCPGRKGEEVDEGLPTAPNIASQASQASK